jgi:hypothetical protein
MYRRFPTFRNENRSRNIGRAVAGSLLRGSVNDRCPHQPGHVEEELNHRGKLLSDVLEA